MKTCNKCATEKPLTDFHKSKSNAGGLRTECKTCMNARSSVHRLAHIDEAKAYAAEWQKANAEKVKTNNAIRYKATYHKTKESRAAWQKANSAKVSQCVRAYRKAFPHKVVAWNTRRRASKLQATTAWANDFFIEEIYDLAQLRTKATGYAWHVDHIVPLQGKTVCGLHCEANLQVIPAFDNISKSNRYWPDMPEHNQHAQC